MKNYIIHHRDECPEQPPFNTALNTYVVWQWAVFQEEETGITPVAAFMRKEDAAGFAGFLRLNDLIQETQQQRIADEERAEDEKKEREQRAAELEQKVYQIIRDELDLDDHDLITNDSLIMDDLGSDSLGVIELVLRFEEEYEIDIPDDVVEKLPRVGDVIEYLRKETC